MDIVHEEKPDSLKIQGSGPWKELSCAIKKDK